MSGYTKHANINLAIEADIGSMQACMSYNGEQSDIDTFPNGADPRAHNIKVGDLVVSYREPTENGKIQGFSSLAGSQCPSDKITAEELMADFRVVGIARTNIEKKKTDNQYVSQSIDMAVQIFGMANIRNTGPHEFHAGDEIIPCYPELESIKTRHENNRGDPSVPFAYKRLEPHIPADLCAEIASVMTDAVEPNNPKENDWASSKELRAMRVRKGILDMLKVATKHMDDKGLTLANLNEVTKAAETAKTELVQAILNTKDNGFGRAHNAIMGYYHLNKSRVIGVCKTPHVKSNEEFDILLKI